jgi:hypothetical protein
MRPYGYHSPEPLIGMADLTSGTSAHHSSDDHERNSQIHQ